MNKYGWFDQTTGEYVICRPDTPSPWINYLLGKDLQAFISQAAGGAAWFGEPVHGRLTRYRFNGLPVDSPGFYIYVHDGAVVWNPSFFPVRVPLDHYECRHAPGSTRFLSSKNGILADLRYFIPHNDNVMIWDLRLKNATSSARRLVLHTYIEFSLHDFAKDTEAFLVCGNQYRAYFDKTANGIAVDYFAWEAPFMGRSIFAANRPVRAFEVDRDVFMGSGRTEANPAGLEKGLSGSEVRDGGRYACGVLENELTIPAGATRQIAYLYAVSDKAQISRRLARKYSSAAVIDKAYAGLRRYWAKAFSGAQALTPDPQLNAMLNIWFPFNCCVTFRVGRSISSRHVGSGHALSFRDSMQDVMPCAVFFPDEARSRILALYQAMLASGRTVRAINPKTLRASDADWIRIDAALWGVLAVYRYLVETADYGLLDEVVPYYDAGKGTIFEHLLRGMRFIGEHDGPHGLPRIFNVDWNDMLTLFSSAYEDAQSIMVAEQFMYAARLLLEIMDATGRTTDKAWLQDKTRHYARILNSPVCWDGAWFKRLLMKDMVMGSRSNREGRIFLNTQSWAVIAGSLEPAKLRRAMDSVRRHLATPCGVRLFAPPFRFMLDGKTPFNCNTPGAGENGGIFLHANTWAVMAEALLGRSEQAWSYYHSILPYVLSDRAPEKYANPPYAFTSWIYGPDHERYGSGQLAWLTGGASWMHTVSLEYILGVHPTLSGIVFNPCVPEGWPEYSVQRRLRGCLYSITVREPHGVSKGPVAIEANGRHVQGNMLPYVENNRCRVIVSGQSERR